MKYPISCREATKSDLPGILRLYAQPELDDGNVLAINDAEMIFQRIRSYRNYKLFVAVREGAVVGTFALLIMDNLGHRGAPSAIIEDLVVDHLCQGQGIGKDMVAFALQQATQTGCYKAMLSSNLKREHAHRFYESLGFERHGYSYRINIQQDTKAVDE